LFHIAWVCFKCPERDWFGVFIGQGVFFLFQEYQTINNLIQAGLYWKMQRLLGRVHETWMLRSLATDSYYYLLAMEDEVYVSLQFSLRSHLMVHYFSTPFISSTHLPLILFICSDGDDQ